MKNLVIIFLVLNIIVGTVVAEESNRIAIVVNSYLKPQIEDSLATFLLDLTHEGYDPILKEWSLEDQPDPEELKAYLKNLYQQADSLQGAIFIGNLPIAIVHDLTPGKKHANAPFPADHFYMDLEGDWGEKNKKGNYVPTPTVESLAKTAIWVSRLQASNLSKQDDSNQAVLEKISGLTEEVHFIRDYFRKNHEFRTGKKLYIERTWVIPYGISGAENLDFTVNASFDRRTDFFSSDMGKDRFLQLLEENSELGMWAFHGENHKLYITSRGGIDSKELLNNGIAINTAFLLPISCYIGQYNIKNYFAGAVLFAEKSDVLAIISATTEIPYWYRNFFNYSFSRDENMGKSYLYYLQQKKYQPPVHPFDELARVILGDGTLKRQYNVPGEDEMPDQKSLLRSKDLLKYIIPSFGIIKGNSMHFDLSKNAIFWDKYYVEDNLEYRLFNVLEYRVMYQGKENIVFVDQLSEDDLYELEYVWNFENESLPSLRAMAGPLTLSEYLKRLEKFDTNLMNFILEDIINEEEILKEKFEENEVIKAMKKLMESVLDGK